MHFPRLAAAATLAFFAGCNFDLSLPTTPLQGGITGSLVLTDTALSAAGQEVVAIDSGGARAAQTTGDDGTFAFTGLAPGSFTLVVKVPTFAPLLEPGVVVKSGQVTDVGALTPQSLKNTPDEATLTGVVAANGGGDVSGAVVEFLIAGQRVGSTAVTASGEFTQKLAPGTYTLRGSHPYYVTGELQDVTLAPGAVRDVTATPLVLDINPATLSGTVLREREGQSAGAAAGVTVTLSTGQTTVTDAAGAFTLTGLAAGQREVTLQLANHLDVIPARPVLLEPGKTSNLGTVTLRLVRGTIVGQVRMADNSSVEGVTVSVVGTPYAANVSSGGGDAGSASVGGFTIPNVPPGVYEVSATKNEYSRFTVQVTVAGDTVNAGDLELTRLQGDFDIDDGDNANTPGYTRSTAVTLKFTSFPSTGVASWRAGEGDLSLLPWLPYTGPNQPFTLSAAQGLKTVKAQYRDSAMNVSAEFTSSVVLDSVLPTVSAVAFEATGTVGTTRFTNVAQNLLLSLQGADTGGSGVARMRVGTALDGSSNVVAPAVAYQSPTQLVRPSAVDGVQVVWVQLLDAAGNASTALSDSIVVDTAPPTGSLTIQQGPQAAEAGYTNQALVSLSLSTGAEPNGGVVSVRLANASGTALDSATLQPTAATVSWLIDPSAEGLKTVYARFRDSAGNQSTVASGTITYDTTPPTPATLAVSGRSTVNARPVTLVLGTNTTDLATLGLTVSEDPFYAAGGSTVGPLAFPGTAQLSFTLSDADGPRTVYARYRDRSGNSAQAAVPVTLDRSPPTLSVAVLGTLADGTPSSTATASTTVAVTVSTNEAVDVIVSDAALTTCTSATPGWAPLASATFNRVLAAGTGVREVRVCARDAAYNVTGPVTASIALDAAAPSGCALTLTGKKADGTTPPAGKSATPLVTAAIAGCSETPAQLVLSQDPALNCSATTLPWAPFNASAPFLLSGPDGANTVRGCVRDAARNTATLSAVAVTLDTTPPLSPRIVIDDGAQYLNDATALLRGGNIGQVQGTATDAIEWALSESASSFGTWGAYPGTQPRNFTFGGTGVRTLYGAFRDDVGNQSAVAFAQVDIDRTAPNVGGTTVRLTSSAPDPEYTNSVSVVFSVAGLPSDAFEVKLASAAGGACAAGDFAAALKLPATTDYTFLLTSTEGPKRGCLQAFDRAGNGTATFPTDTITLDTTAPAALQVLTQSKALSLADNAGLLVRVSAPAADPSFSRYQAVGGKLASWTTTSPTGTPPAGTLDFPFNVENTGSPEEGTPNQLQLRMVDRAGNAGPASGVTIVADDNRPEPVAVQGGWVDNGDGLSTVYWQPSSSGDVVNHQVRYDSANMPWLPSGTYAAEGISPVLVGTQTSFTLSSLPNGAPTFVSVAPVDRAGNVGLESPQVALHPNRVSINALSQLTIGDGFILKLAIEGSMLYVLWLDRNTCAGSPQTGSTYLAVVDIRHMVGPVQSGAINPAPLAPKVVASLGPFADQAPCDDPVGDLQLDGPWLYAAAGRRLRAISVATPHEPVSLASVDFLAYAPTPTGFYARTVDIAGDRAVVASRDGLMGTGGYVASVNLARLFDGSAATTLGTADIVGMQSLTTEGVEAAVFTRDRVVSLPAPLPPFGPNSNFAPYVFNAAELLDGDALYTVTNVGVANRFLGSNARPLANGNYLYTSSDETGFTVSDLTAAWTAVAFNWGIPPVVQTAVTSRGQFVVSGDQAFLVDKYGFLRVLDLQDITRPGEDSLFPTISGGHVALDGNYLVVGAKGVVQFLELAAPRAITFDRDVANVGHRPTLNGGFVISRGGVTVDAQTPVLARQTNDISECLVGSTTIDNLEIMADGPRISARSHERGQDRDPSTSLAPKSSLSLSTPGASALDVEEFGNFLAVAEARADGLWLSVFDIRKWRDRDGTTVVNPVGDLRGSLRLDTRSIALGWALSSSVAMSRFGSKLLVSVDFNDAALAPSAWTTGPNAYIVDLAGAIDDTAATAFTAATAVQATYTLPRAREGVLRWPYVYLPTRAGVHVFNAFEALDTSLVSTVPAGRAATLSVDVNSGWDHALVHGSYLFATPDNSGGFPSLSVWDVSSLPTSPPAVPLTGVPRSFFLPMVLPSTTTCNYGANPYVVRTMLQVSGSKLWLNVRDSLREFNLE